jgi:hypothetical protein
MGTRGSDSLGFSRLYVRELRLSLRINAGAYGFSVMITATLAMVASIHSAPAPGELFLFIVGAVASFAVVESFATRGFTREPKDHEPAEVVALGSSLSLFSIASAVATSWLAATLLPDTLSWLVCPFAAATVYVVVLGVEMSVARRIEEARNIE